MFCSRCGKQLPDGAAFCSGCGANVQQQGEQLKRIEKDTVLIQKLSKISNVYCVFVLNLCCMMAYLIPWVEIGSIDILGLFEIDGSKYNIIDLCLANTGIAKQFYKILYNQDISSMMNFLKVICCIGIVAMVWHLVSMVYVLVKKQDTPLQYMVYGVDIIISLMFIWAKSSLKNGDFLISIPIDPEKTGGLASSASFDLTDHLSVTCVPEVMLFFAGIALVIYILENRKKRR